MTIPQILHRATALYPHETALRDGKTIRTYSELSERVSAFSQALFRRGVSSGDRIAVLDVNSSEYIECYFAGAMLGAIICPLNYRLSAEELAGILLDCQAKILIMRDDFAETIRQTVHILTENSTKISLQEIIILGENTIRISDIIPQNEYENALYFTENSHLHDVKIDENSTAHLYYTSGTTGKPKGVQLSHKNVTSHAIGTLAELHITDTDVWAHIAPMFHLADAWAVFAITLAGGTHIILPKFEARAALLIFEKERVTITNLVPTMLNLMVKHPEARQFDYSSLRVILSGGAPIAPTVVREVMDTFSCDYVQTYGMTETSPYLTLSSLKRNQKQWSADAQFTAKAKTGKPFITIELRVVDETNTPIKANDTAVGEIQVRGSSVTSGYWQRPEETQKAFTEDGWLKTGDLATLDAEGFVTIVDRKKDMIISGGENVYSTEVEYTLAKHDAVLECAVFGIPDEIWGETVCAAVVVKPHISAEALSTPHGQSKEQFADELQHFCRTHIAHYKVPRKIFFLKELPRTGSGKITKKPLREMAQESVSPST